MQSLALRLPLVALVLAACSATSGSAVVASTPGTIGVGTQRLLFGLLDADGRPVGGPSPEVTVELRRDGDTIVEAPSEWVWTIEGERGFHAVVVDLDTAGTWEVVLHPEGGPPTPPTSFAVVEDVLVPEVGERAPASETPTHPDRPLGEITTDPDPDPALYEISVADAVTSGRPSVVVFASPAFCQTATCGPVVDAISEIRNRHPDAAFVHVEVYEDLREGDALVPVPAVTEWRLPSEPWIFVIAPDGTVAARFEGTASAAEIDAALAEQGA